MKPSEAVKAKMKITKSMKERAYHTLIDTKLSLREIEKEGLPDRQVVEVLAFVEAALDKFVHTKM